MEIIDRNNCPGNGENNEQPTAQQLLETVKEWKGADLGKLLEGYFSMIDNLDSLDSLKGNLDNYECTIKNLKEFSKLEFMEKKAWRVYDNGETEESCGAHLRNLLSPFKNMIAVIKSFSKGEIKEETLKSLIEGCRANLDENKEKLLEFCKFLKK